MSTDESPYSPPAGSPPDPDEDLDRSRREGPDDRLPPPVFTPVVGRRPLHRAPHLPPAGASLPPHAVYGPDDPPRARVEPPATDPPAQSAGDAREARARDLASVLDRLAEELRVSGTLRFVPNPGSDTVEAALRGFLSGVLLSGARSERADRS